MKPLGIKPRKKQPSPIDVHVGQCVRAARRERGFSQEKLGDALSLTFQQVQKYEKGVNRIGSSRMVQIAQTLGKPVAWFYPPETPSGEPIGRDLAVEIMAATYGRDLATAFLAIESKEARYALLNIAKVLGKPERAQAMERAAA